MAPIAERTVADLEGELRAARARLANAERELTATSTRLEGFATRYRLILGHRFKVLKTLQPGASDDGGQLGDAALTVSRPARLPGHADFERLYRDLARQVHPDLALDANERKLRTRIMAELNDARGALDFDRARQIRTAWELRSDRIDDSAGLDRGEYLLAAIERTQARFTAVTADITRLEHSNLNLLLNVVEAQERSGVDVLAETAADLDHQIADARVKLSVVPVAHRAAPEIREEDRELPAAPTAAARQPMIAVAAALAALVSAACLGLLVVSFVRGQPDAPVLITRAEPTQSVSVQPDTQATPQPLRYQVAERTLSTSGRTTVTVRIVVDGTPSTAEKISTIAEAAHREIGSQQAVLVLGYRSLSETGGPFTIGRAYMSVDGRGWSGDGSTDDGPDRGGVTGSVVVSIGGSIDTQPFSVRR